MNFAEIEVGRKFEVGPVTIDREKAVAFAREYDPLPIHWDEEHARGTRFGGLVAPGVMCFMTAWAQFIRQNPVGDNLIAGKSTKIEWLAPIRPGDRIRGDIVVTDKVRRNPYNGIVVITCDFYNQDGEHVMRDVTEAVVAG